MSLAVRSGSASRQAYALASVLVNVETACAASRKRHCRAQLFSR